MANPMSAKAQTYVSILAYAKTLPNYSKHKPVLTINQDVYPEYFDYFIGLNGMLYIVLVLPDGLVATNSKFEVIIADPASIQAVNFDSEFGIDVTAAPAYTGNGVEVTSFFRKVLQACASGSNNYGVPYRKLKISCQSDWFYWDSPVFIDTVKPYFVLRADSICLPLKTTVKQDILLFYEDIISVSIPLIDLPSVLGSLASSVPTEIIEARNNLLKTYGLSDTKFPQWIDPAIKARNGIPPYMSNEKCTFNGKTYISQRDMNGTVPGTALADGWWKEFTATE